MAKTVAESLIAEVAEIGMNVLLARHGQLVDAEGVFGPIKVEVLPKRSGSEIKHCAPVVTNEFDCASDWLAEKHIITEECADAFCVLSEKNIRTVAESRDCLNGCGGLVALAVRHLLPDAFGGLLCERCHF